MKNIKIKVAMVANNLELNGISGVMINYCSNINHDDFQISILAGEPINPSLKKKCDENDICLIKLPPRKAKPWAHYRKLSKELSSGYDIVHIHCNSATAIVELLIAYLRKIRVRIIHSHNTTCTHKLFHKLAGPFFRKLYTGGVACGNEAGKWMFGNQEFIVLKNGIETEKFYFNQAKRNEIREEIGVENKYVIGTIARFNDQKNHPFLLKVFREVAAERDDMVLLLVGDGPDLEKVLQLIDKHPYKDRIIYYGETNHPEFLYNAFDVFVLPSKFEGFGICFLEAQINGLPVITSDRVNCAECTEMMSFLSLDNTEIWKKTILNVTAFDRINASVIYNDAFEEYDIRRNAQELEKYYKKSIELLK